MIKVLQELPAHRSYLYVEIQVKVQVICTSDDNTKIEKVRRFQH